MPARAHDSLPLLAILSDNLSVPPSAGDQIHLLSLARAAAGSVPTRVFAWADTPEGLDAPEPATVSCWSRRGPQDPPHLVKLARAGAMAQPWRRAHHYVSRAWEWIDANAPAGSVIWVRRHSTALAILPRLLDRRARRRYRFLYDVSSFLRLEVAAGARGRLDDLKGRLEERLWRRFDLLRTLSDPMRDHLIVGGVPAERILVVPVGAVLPERCWQPRRPEEGPRRVLYVGSASAWQGLDELLAAMRILADTDPDIRLSIVGIEREALGKEIVGDNVDCLGRLPHERAAAMYLDHDLFVLPRPRLPLTEMVVPMKIVEALAHGVPILATDLPAVRWVTGGDAARLIESNRPTDLADAIRVILAQPEELARLGREARTRAATFEWDRIGSRIADQLFSA